MAMYFCLLNYYRTSTSTATIICPYSPVISIPNLAKISTVECLAESSNTTAHLAFGCKMDSNKNPLQGCFNGIVYFCETTHIQGNSDRIAGCKKFVNLFFSDMNPAWISLRRECGQWSWTDSYIGSLGSNTCTTAENNLKAAYPEYVQSIDSLKSFLWNNTLLSE